MKNEVIFSVLFKSSKSEHDRMELIEFLKEISVERQFFNWISEKKDLIEKEIGEPTVIANCKIIKY